MRVQLARRRAAVWWRLLRKQLMQACGGSRGSGIRGIGWEWGRRSGMGEWGEDVNGGGGEGRWGRKLKRRGARRNEGTEGSGEFEMSDSRNLRIGIEMGVGVGLF